MHVIVILKSTPPKCLKCKLVIAQVQVLLKKVDCLLYVCIQPSILLKHLSVAVIDLLGSRFLYFLCATVLMWVQVHIEVVLPFFHAVQMGTQMTNNKRLDSSTLLVALIKIPHLNLGLPFELLVFKKKNSLTCCCCCCCCIIFSSQSRFAADERDGLELEL